MTFRARLPIGLGLLFGLLAGCGGALPDNGAAGLAFVALDGGCFAYGESRIYPEEGPVTEACVEPFSITAHEITIDQYAAFVADTGYKTRAERGWAEGEEGGPGVLLPPGSALFAPPGIPGKPLSWWRFEEGVSWRTAGTTKGSNGRLPAVHLTRPDADAFAAWAGGRLPTEQEWEYAARGGLDGSLYSWSEAEDAAIEDRANTWQGVFPFVNTGADGYEGLAPVGSFPPNGFGLYDMVGNVWEWTSSAYYPTHAPTEAMEAVETGMDPTQPGIPVGVIKGGSYLCVRTYCYRFRPAARQPQDLAFGTSHLGFRVVRDKSRGR